MLCNVYYYLKEFVEIEMNLVIDNLIVISEEEVILGGGFYG